MIQRVLPLVASPTGRPMAFAGLALAFFLGCKGKDEGSSPPAASSTPMAIDSSPVDAGPPARKTQPAPPAKKVTATTTDGVEISGSLWAGGEPTAPAVILVHRLGGTHREWIPLIERVFPPQKPFNALAIDLRGHGESVKKRGKRKKLAWPDFKKGEYSKLVLDAEAAIGLMNQRTGGPPTSLVLVGSDLGATASVSAAKSAGPSLTGVALISPGAALRGVDLYKPFGNVLALPNLVIASKGDNVAHEPMLVLSKMSPSSTLINLDGRAHGADYLGAEHTILWDRLADWVEARVAGEGIPGSGPAVSASAAPSLAPAVSAPSR